MDGQQIEQPALERHAAGGVNGQHVEAEGRRSQIEAPLAAAPTRQHAGVDHHHGQIHPLRRGEMDIRLGIQSEQRIGADGGAVGPQGWRVPVGHQVQRHQPLVAWLAASHVQTTVDLKPQQPQRPELAGDQAAAEVAIGELKQAQIQTRGSQLGFELLDSLEPVERSHRSLHYLSGPTLPWAAGCS